MTERPLGKPRKSLADRFWPKVDKRGPDECWPWKATVGRGGYGKIASGGKTGRYGQMLPAHRVSYELNHGPIQAGLFVCHACDNRLCVNPSHLWLGSHQDNMDDRGAKGRARGRFSKTTVTNGPPNPNRGG